MASKSKSRRRVFRASCILAALIVAGSSFAWFSSKDEVTNRLSASANYGVSIVEDFQPPKNFLPGQKVNKDVAVVNTGNVDAFVRTWIDGEMSVVKREALGSGTSVVDTSVDPKKTKTDIYSATPKLTATESTQTKLTGVNLNWYDNADNTKYYKELSQKKSKNPLNTSTDSHITLPEADNDKARFSEVQSVQAGGVLVYHDVDATNPGATASAEYYYVLEQATTIEGYEYDTTDPSNPAFSATKTTKTYPAGTYVCTAGSVVATDNSITNKVKIPYDYYGNIDTSNFYPETEGLYLFRRNVDLADAANTVDDYEYTGYYFFKDTTKTTTTATEGTNDKPDTDKRDRSAYNPVYLALEYDNTRTAQRSDYVLRDADVTTRTSDPTKDEILPVTLNDVRLFTAKEHILNSYAGTATTYKVNDATTSEVVEADVSIPPYSHKIKVGSDYYYGSGETGTFYKNDGGTINTTISVEVTKETNAVDGLEWTYAADASTTTYTLTKDSDSSTVACTGAPADDSTRTGYTKKISTASGDYYFYSANSKYYADADTDSRNTPYTLSSTTTPATTGVLSATYGTGDEEIKVNVKLANIDNAPTASTAETWSVVKDATDSDKWTFYYNNDVEEGASTTKLIDYVELDKDVKDEAFLAFDFDLNVFMESAQVVLNEQGDEVCEPIVAPWGNTSSTEPNVGNTNFTAATGAKGGSGAEIESITWTAVTP